MAIALQVKRGTFANMPTLVAGEFYYATDTARLYVGPTPTLVGPSAGGGSGAQGTSSLNFGTFPGGSDAQAIITGQAGILLTSVVEAWIMPAATADHSVDEHWAESIEVVAGNIVAGTGFTIYGMSNSFSGLETPRIYGLWNVAWKWS